MTRTRSIQTLTAAAAVLSLALARGTYAQDTSEARIQDLIRISSARLAAAGQAGSTAPAAQTPAGPTVRLSMDDVIKLTLDRNLSIAVQRLNPQINDLAVANLFTNYHPIVSSTLSQRSLTTAPTSVLNIGTTTAAPITDTFTYNGTITENSKWGGGNFAATLLNSRQTNTSNTVTYNPLFTSTWTLNYTQPLLQNFKIDLNREQIYIAKINRDMSDVQLRSTITNTVANAQTAYWEYVYASQAVDVAQDSLRIANQLVADNNTRVEVGTMAPLDVLTAQSQAATASQALIQAQATKRTDEIALKQFLVAGTDDPNWNLTIEAVDRPDFNPQPIDLPAALRRALSERTDLQLAKQTVEENDVTMRYLHDQTRPQANLVVAYGTNGIGGDALVRGTSTLGSPVTTTIPGGITDAFSSLFARDYPTWTAGLTVSYPLFLSSQQATLARARVQLNQVTAQLKQTELQVATDVTNAVISVQNSVEAVNAAQVSVDLAQRQLDAEQAKLDVGMSTNYNVVLAQQTLSTARSSQVRAIANYREALVSLDRLQQTTLTGANITIVGH